jgi:ectoine utilization protein EutE
MNVETSRIATDVDFTRDGKQTSFLRAPSSTNQSGYGTVLIPITVIKHGSGPTLLMTGAVHGDEYEGPMALAKLGRSLQPEAVQGRLILLPALNLPALMAGTRLSPVDGLNLNRVFPGEANGSLTQMIAHYVSTVLIPMGDIVVDLHSGGMTLDYIPCVALHEQDDAQWMRTTMAALQAFGAPVALISRELDNAVYLDTIAENLGKITLSAELGGAGTVAKGSLAIAEMGVLNLLRHFAMVEGEVVPPQRVGRAATRLMQTPDFECYAIATDDGTYEPFVELGDAVEAGQALGQIHFLHRHDREPVPIVSRRSGMLICRRPLAQVKAGDCLGIVAWDYPTRR